MTVTTKINMPVYSFRRIENPSEQDGKKIYLAVIRAKDLAKELEDWREINPRDPKVSSGVAKKIASTLQEEPESFLFRNRGVTLLAQHVSYNNATKELSVEFSDKTVHGLLDGGHTFAVIRDSFDSLSDEEADATLMNDAYVKLEILEGFPLRSETVEIVGARNTSTQVKDQSLANLLRHFDSIKDILADRSYADHIAYKEIEFNEEGGKKDIDIKEILSYLVCFDREGFDDENHPVIAYSGKASVLKYVESNRERLQKYLPLLPDILELRDEIYENMPQAWNRQNGKFGALQGVNVKRSKMIELPFKGTKTEYVIPSAFIYPVLAAFRNLVEVKGGTCSWVIPPVEFFHENQVELVRQLCDQALVFRNPTKLGKEKTVWQLCYYCVAMALLKSGAKVLDN